MDIIKKFVSLCATSVNPDLYSILVDEILPALELARGPNCGQLDTKGKAGKADIDYEVEAGSIEQVGEAMIMKTAIPYHPDDCPGCVHVYRQKDQYNLIFKCNECGDQRKLTLDPDDGFAFPIGLTSPANGDEIAI